MARAVNDSVFHGIPRDFNPMVHVFQPKARGKECAIEACGRPGNHHFHTGI